MKNQSLSPGQLGRDSELFGEVDERRFVVALARGLEVLRAFTPTESMLSVGELAGKTGLPRPTVARLAYTLERLGYLVYSRKLARYQLAANVLTFGYSALPSLRIRQVSKDLMRELAEFSGAGVALGVRDRLEMVYVDFSQAAAAMMHRPSAGSRIPLATSAMGRAVLACLPEKERQWLMEHIERRTGETWPSVRDGIEQSVREVQERGFASAFGSFQRDVNGVGVGLVLPDGAGVFGFNCGGPAYLIGRERLETEVGPRLVSLVEAVRARLAEA